jgi:hypothetical protein
MPTNQIMLKHLVHLVANFPIHLQLFKLKKALIFIINLFYLFINL